MTDRDKGLCCAIKGLKLADPGKVRHRTRIVMPEGMIWCSTAVEGQFCECACGYSLAQEGSPQIRVLVGGLTAWKARGFPLDTVTTELAERIAEMKRLGIELIPSPWSPPPAEAPPASD